MDAERSGTDEILLNRTQKPRQRIVRDADVWFVWVQNRPCGKLTAALPHTDHRLSVLDQRVGVVAKIDHLTAGHTQPVAPFVEASTAAGSMTTSSSPTRKPPGTKPLSSQVRYRSIASAASVAVIDRSSAVTLRPINVQTTVPTCSDVGIRETAK